MHIFHFFCVSLAYCITYQSALYKKVQTWFYQNNEIDSYRVFAHTLVFNTESYIVAHRVIDEHPSSRCHGQPDQRPG